MQKQMSLFATFSYTSFSAEQKDTLLTDPKAGALMAVYAVDDLFSHLIAVNFLSLEKDLLNLREKIPNPQNDMLYWLNFIQRNPYIIGAYLDEQGKYLFQKAEFLLTVVHLVAWQDVGNAKFMFGESAPNTASTRTRAGTPRRESFISI